MNKIYKRLNFSKLFAIFTITIIVLFAITACKKDEEESSLSTHESHAVSVESKISVESIVESEKQSVVLESKEESVVESESVKVVYCTVVFDSVGGTAILEQTIEKGDLVAMPLTPQKEGFSFDGWYLGDNPFDFSTPIQENLVLVAKWTKLETNQLYSVVFVTDCEQTISSQTIENNGVVSRPSNPTKDGFIFIGWYLDGEEYDFATPVTQNLVLVAKWEEVTTFTVTFISEDEVISTQSVEAGKNVIEPQQPQRAGCVFVGWYLNGEAFNFSQSITTNVTLVAVWKEVDKTYTITFDSQGGSNVQAQVVELNNFVIKPENPYKQGFVFNCWLLNGEEYDFSTPVENSFVLVAVWQAKESAIGFVGSWVGEEVSSFSTYQYSVIINSETDGKIIVSANNYTAEYAIAEVYLVGNELNLICDRNGKEYLLIFIVSDNYLVCDCGLYCESLTLSKSC